MEMEISKPQEKENQAVTRNQENELSSQVNKIVADYPQKKGLFNSKTKFNNNSVVIITAVVILTLLLVVGKILTLSSKNQSQTKNQVATQTLCKTPNIKKPSEPYNYPQSDCEFKAYEDIEIAELDKASCKRLSRYLIVDKNNVYKQLYDPGSSDLPIYVIIKEADANSFESLNNGYYKDSFNLFNDSGNSYKIVRNVDLDSVQILSTHYLKDQNNIYFAQLYKLPNSTKYVDDLTAMPEFDVETFEIIQNKENHEQYFRDKNGVYFKKGNSVDSKLSRISEADTPSFEVLDSYLMAKDKNFVYREGKIIDGADPKSFVVLGTGYFKDYVRVYTSIGGFRRYPNRDGCSFELINYTDQYSWKGYSKDKNNVYYRDAIVEGADPNSFRVDGDKAFDKNYEYKGIYRVED